MEASVDGLEVVSRDMSINLCGCDIRMTQEFLDHPEIGPSFQKVSGERMTECVRSDFLLDAGQVSVFSYQLPNPLPGKRSPVSTSENIFGCL